MTKISAIQTIETPKRKNAHIMLLGAGGAVAGGAARYIMPLKDELSQGKDTFFSNAKMQARAQDRSILKFAGIGALIAMGIGLVAKIFSDSKIPAQKKETIEYSKLGALIDAPDYACEIMWWSEP